MTKKDYITIANALKPYYKEISPEDAYGVSSQLILNIINSITKEIKKDNPTFDPIKFLDYLRA